MSDNALARSQSIMDSLRKTVSCQIGGDQILSVCGLCGPVKIVVAFHVECLIDFGQNFM
jgi:hypothetical protein